MSACVGVLLGRGSDVMASYAGFIRLSFQLERKTVTHHLHDHSHPDYNLQSPAFSQELFSPFRLPYVPL